MESCAATTSEGLSSTPSMRSCKAFTPAGADRACKLMHLTLRVLPVDLDLGLLMPRETCVLTPGAAVIGPLVAPVRA